MTLIEILNGLAVIVPAVEEQATAVINELKSSDDVGTKAERVVLAVLGLASAIAEHVSATKEASNGQSDSTTT